MREIPAIASMRRGCPRSPVPERCVPSRNFRIAGNARNARTAARPACQKIGFRNYNNAMAAMPRSSSRNRAHPFGETESNLSCDRPGRSLPTNVRAVTYRLIKTTEWGAVAQALEADIPTLHKTGHFYFALRVCKCGHLMPARRRRGRAAYQERATAPMILASASTSRVSITSPGECE